MTDNIILSFSVQERSSQMIGFMDAVCKPKKLLLSEQPLQLPWLVDEVPSQALPGRQQNIKQYAKEFMKVANITRDINEEKNVAL